VCHDEPIARFCQDSRQICYCGHFLLFSRWFLDVKIGLVSDAALTEITAL
jgi:hypothetical protein